jgi:hypothetical protein
VLNSRYVTGPVSSIGINPYLLFVSLMLEYKI